MFLFPLINNYIENRMYGLPTESHKKVNILFISILITFVFSVLYIPITFITQFLAARYTMYFSMALMAGLFFGLRKSNWKLIAQLFVFSIWLMAMMLIFFSGGANSFVISWLILVPIISVVLLNRNGQLFWLFVSIVSNYLFLVLPPPHHTLVYVSSWPGIFNTTLCGGLMVMIYVLVKSFKTQQNNLLSFSENQNDELRAAEEELRQSLEELSTLQEVLTEQNAKISSSEQKTKIYLQTLISLATCKGISEGDLEKAHSQILEESAKVLKTSRISIWRYHPKGEYLESISQFDENDKRATKGIKLFKKDFVPYFEAIILETIIEAENAREHPSTSCFTDSYLKPLQIYSLLDVPYFENGKFVGVICCEQQFSMRNWDQEDILFVKSVADLISLANNSSLRKEAELEIANQREKISEQNEELRKFAHEISQINESLEKRVSDRTQILKEQNQRFKEYAFVNSHLLRGPLSRILGLAEVVRLEHDFQEIKKMAILINYSAGELDEIVHKINKILEEGIELDRDILKNSDNEFSLN